MRRVGSEKIDCVIAGLISILFGAGLAKLGLDRYEANVFGLRHPHVYGEIITKTPTRPAGKYGAHDFLFVVEFELPNGDPCREAVSVRLDDLAVVGGPIELVPRESCANPVVVVKVSSAPYWCGSALAIFCGIVML